MAYITSLTVRVMKTPFFALSIADWNSSRSLYHIYSNN